MTNSGNRGKREEKDCFGLSLVHIIEEDALLNFPFLEVYNHFRLGGPFIKIINRVSICTVDTWFKWSS